MSWANSQLDQSKNPETELRLIQHNWDLSLATLVALWKNCFRIRSKNYQAFLFSYVIEIWFNVSISHALIEKSKNVDFSMILCIWIWFCWIVRQKCFLIFGQTLLILTKVWSSWVEWYWIEVFEPSKRAQILNHSKIFNFIHDRHIFLALLDK